MLSQITKTLIATCLLTKAAEALDLVAYWGQNSGGDQGPLRDYCASSTADVIVVSFLNSINPVDINLSNQCGATFADGTLHCSAVGEDITYCQEQGKKVLLSIGGHGAAGFSSDSEATTFATNIWNKFAGGSSDERPFDAAVVDGFDLDLEAVGPTGTVAFGNAIKALFSKDSSKSYYLSASPQCPYPDATLSDYLTQVPIDYTFVQFYNNPSCQLDGDFNFNTWSQYVNSSSPNSNNQIFVGLPGSSTSGSGFVSASVVESQLEQIKCDPNLGGVSLWDASSSFSNGYASSIRSILDSIDVDACQASTSTASSAVAPSSAAVVSTSAPIYSNTTTEAPIATKTNIHTTVVTITSCSDNKCTKVPVTTGLTTVTDHELNTIYTTYCPLSDDSTATVSHLSTTLVTVTECADNKCQEKEVVTGLTTVTDHVLNTVYTTYCPIEAEETSVPVVITTPAPVKPITSPTLAPYGNDTTVTVTIHKVAVNTGYTTYCPEETSAAPTKAVVTKVAVASNSVAPVPTAAPTDSTSLTTLTLQTTVTRSAAHSSSVAGNSTVPAVPTLLAGMASSTKGSIALVVLSIVASLF